MQRQGRHSEWSPQPAAGGCVKVRVLVSGRHTQHRPGEIRPKPDRVQRDGRSNRRQTRHDAHLSPGRIRRRSETAAEHWVNRIRTDDGAAVGVDATYTDPNTHETSRVVINAPSVVAAAGSSGDPGAAPSVGHRWACRRGRTAAAPREPRQRHLRGTSRPVVRPGYGRDHERVRRSERGLRVPHRMCPAPSWPVHHRRPLARRRRAQGAHPQVSVPGRLGVHRQGPWRRIRHPRRERSIHVLVSIHRRSRSPSFP